MHQHVLIAFEASWDNKTATLLNGASAAYRAVTWATSGATAS
jgi:hypothetical protein